MKKFFAAVILAVFVLSFQIAAAEKIVAEGYDWSKAPRFGNTADFARYVENERRKGQNTFLVVLTSDSIMPQVWKSRNIDADDLGRIVTCPTLEIAANIDENGEMRLYFQIVTEYPGTRVANAYLSENQDEWRNLTAEEQKLYNIAVEIVNEANKCTSEREKALYLHNAICDRAKAYKNENERQKTAIGALIDGYAQCQGFSDAFYMLGRMSGLNVGRILGDFAKHGHVWNWITFEDGKSYCIDVTTDFVSKNEVLFCATREIMENIYVDKIDGKKYDGKADYWCEWSIIPNMQ